MFHDDLLCKLRPLEPGSGSLCRAMLVPIVFSFAVRSLHQSGARHRVRRASADVMDSTRTLRAPRRVQKNGRSRAGGGRFSRGGGEQQERANQRWNLCAGEAAIHVPARVPPGRGPNARRFNAFWPRCARADRRPRRKSCPRLHALHAVPGAGERGCFSGLGARRAPRVLRARGRTPWPCRKSSRRRARGCDRGSAGKRSWSAR